MKGRMSGPLVAATNEASLPPMPCASAKSLGMTGNAKTFVIATTRKVAAAGRRSSPTQRSRCVSSLGAGYCRTRLSQMCRGSGCRRRQRLLDLGLEHPFEIVGLDRPDQLVGDATVAADHEGLGYAVNTPFE